MPEACSILLFLHPSSFILHPSRHLDNFFCLPGSRPIRTKPFFRQTYASYSSNCTEGGRPEQTEIAALAQFQSDRGSRENNSEAPPRALRWRCPAEDRIFLYRPDSGALRCSPGQLIDTSDRRQKTRFGPGGLRS